MERMICSNCKYTADDIFPEDKLRQQQQEMGFSDPIVERMGKDDVLCKRCNDKILCRNAVSVYRHFETKLMPDEFEEKLKCGDDWILIAKAELDNTIQTGVHELQPVKDSGPSPDGTAHNTLQASVPPVKSSKPLAGHSITLSKPTTADDLSRLIKSRHDKVKAKWNKNGVIQFKDEYVAILQRTWGAQVQFIIAYSQLTHEGYRLMAIDEGKTGNTGGFGGGVNAYFYFQKMDYVR